MKNRLKAAFRRTRTATLLLTAIMLISLTGCLYPEEQTPGNRASAQEAAETVQDAVNRYKEATGMLPILNSNEDTPVYEKFRIDFAKMQRMGYLSSMPKLAFENGGGQQFLIIDEETDPKVKLLDLRVYQGVDSLQEKVDRYRSTHKGASPVGEEVYPNFRYVDYKKLGTNDPELKSMYSGTVLNLLVGPQGRVYADYGADLMKAVQKSGKTPEAEADLRALLADASYYVPVRSPVYHWVNNSPVAVTATATKS